MRDGLRLLEPDGTAGGLLGASSEGPLEGPAFDIVVVAFPFLRLLGIEAGGRSSDSGGANFDLLFAFLRGVSMVSSLSGASDDGSRVAALRFLDEVEDEGSGAVVAAGLVACGLASELDEPEESLAEERVTLGGMRIGCNRRYG